MTPKLSSTLDNSDTKTIHFLNNKNIVIIPPVFLEGKQIPNFEKKMSFSIITLPQNVFLSNMQVRYQNLNIK